MDQLLGPNSLRRRRVRLWLLLDTWARLDAESREIGQGAHTEDVISEILDDWAKVKRWSESRARDHFDRLVAQALAPSDARAEELAALPLTLTPETDADAADLGDDAADPSPEELGW